MHSKERLERILRGEPIDRIPFALWRHIPPEDTTPEGLVNATVRFVRRWDFDLVKAMFPNRIWTAHWGTDFASYDRGGGFYPIQQYVVREPGDWTKLRPFDPTKGLFGEQIEVLRQLRNQLGPNIPIIATMFTPMTVGLELAGQSAHTHAVTHPKELHAGLGLISEGLADFAEACVQAGADGIFMAVQSARQDALSAQQFQEFGLAYDLPILERVRSKTWFNILHLCKPHLRFETVRFYPVQAVNWHDRGTTGPSLRAAREMFEGILIAGLDHEGTGAFVQGVPAEAAAQARDAIEQVQGKGFILGPGCVSHLGTPEANIDAAHQVIQNYKLQG
ncbi:MAG: hypothetical protein IT331_00680 [Anaerolineae bacterium]|nr:hypothetical protein [Anaerolineae bacterium]